MDKLIDVLKDLGFKHTLQTFFEYWIYRYPDNEGVVIGHYKLQGDANKYNEGFLFKVIYHTMDDNKDPIFRCNTPEEVIQFISEE